MKRVPAVLAVLALAGAAAFWLLTAPDPLDAAALPAGHTPDLVNGETLFWAGGCASCHAAPDAEGDAKLSLSGGVELATPFGTFRAPNISPDPEHGIGGWSDLDFVNAMVRGLSPDGQHYYPAFPYPYYRRMTLTDLLDLKAFLDTLPPSDHDAAGHELPFPFSIRRGLGLWKRLYLAPADEGFAALPDEPAQVRRGRYLVQGPGHCGACHTPRDLLGGERADRLLAGAAPLEITVDADGDGGDDAAGRIPNITPHADGIGDWSALDIAYALESGFDPDFDSFGGSMVDVQANMAKLPAADREAIAAYLKTVPPLPSEPAQ